jgi:hypothetical protein
MVVRHAADQRQTEAGPERARIEGIAIANQRAFQGLLADAFKLREPIAFAAWLLSIARSLSRGLDRSR